MPLKTVVVISCWRECDLGQDFSLLSASPLFSLFPQPPVSHPFLARPVYLIFEIPLESRDESQPPDDSGQGLKHSHKSGAHLSATVKLCERLVSVALALSLYGLLWLFSVKRPDGVI